MVIAISATERHEFIVEDERGTDNPTKFFIRFLTASETAALEDDNYKFNPLSKEIRICRGALKILAMKAGLDGWENFCDENGEEVEFQRDKKDRIILGRGRHPISDKCLDRLPPSVMTEVADAIIEGITLTEDEKGNSS